MRTRTTVMTAGLAAVLAATPATSAPAAPAASGFTAKVTNPYYPVRPGMRWVYRGQEGGAPARDVVRVTGRVAMVDGVPCAVVKDRLYRRGRLVERTTDWFTQDGRGRVWYYGEATAELDRHGRVTSTEGSWRAGRDGARPGMFMPARPRVGQAFQQEDYPGHAEDHFAILSLRATIRVPLGTYRGRALKTKEWTPLEPGVSDRKWYVRGVGEVAEATVAGGSDRLKLAAFTR
jgi:hypothetical protein